VLAVNSDRHAYEARSGNRFQGSKIARMNYVGAEFFHEVHKPEQGKLEARFGESHSRNLRRDVHLTDKVVVHAADSANLVFEFCVPQTPYNF
jgi:hypothetical protein